MMIQLLHAAFVYQSPDGEVEALRDVSFGVAGGGVCAASLGPSGCGKSTLLSALVAGMERSRRAGEVRADGRAGARRRRGRRG